MVQHAEQWACTAQQVMLLQAAQKPTGDTALPSLLLMGYVKQVLQVRAPPSSGVHRYLPRAELAAPVVLHDLGSHNEDRAPPAGTKN